MRFLGLLQGRLLLLTRGDRRASLSQAESAIKERAELLVVLEQDRSRLVREMEKLYDLYQSGAIDQRGFGAKYHPLAEREHQLEEEIPKAQAELDVRKTAHLSQEEIVNEARDLFTKWPSLPFEERRRVVEAITERITVGKDAIEIDLYYASAPASSEVRCTPRS